MLFALFIKCPIAWWVDDKVFGAAELTIFCTEKLIRDPFFFTSEKIFKSASQNFCVERNFLHVWYFRVTRKIIKPCFSISWRKKYHILSIYTVEMKQIIFPCLVWHFAHSRKVNSHVFNFEFNYVVYEHYYNIMLLFVTEY